MSFFSIFHRNKKIGKTLNFKTRYRNSLLRKQAKKPVKPTRLQKTLPLLSHQKKRVPVVRKSILLIFVLVVMIGTSYFAFFSNFFLIQKTSFTIEEEHLDPKELAIYLDTLRGKNLFLLPAEKIQAAVLTTFPEASAVSINKIFPSSISVQIKTYPIVANIINKYGDFEKKFLINKNGTLVASEVENPNLPYLLVQSEKTFTLKSNLIKPDRLEKILLAHNGFIEKFNLKIFYADYKVRERELHLLTEKHFTVLIDLEQNIEKQLNKLKSALPYLDIYKIPLEYIDLRIPSTYGKKIFFKRRK